MMMALAATDAIPVVLVPDGVTLLPEVDDLWTTRLRWNMPPKLDAARAPPPGGACQFLETAATAQVIGEACASRYRIPHLLLPDNHLAGCRQAFCESSYAVRSSWHRSARCSEATIRRKWHRLSMSRLAAQPICCCINPPSHAAELERPLASDWGKVNRQVPYLVDAAQRARELCTCPDISGQRRS